MNFPTNVIPYAIGSPIFAFFAWRGWRNYIRLHNPLSLYFALSGLFACLSFTSYCLPFIFGSNSPGLVIANIVGDLFLYVMFITQAFLVHYLVLRGKFPVWVFTAPLIVLAISGWLSHCYGYIHYGISIVDNKVIYTLPIYSSIVQMVLIVNVFLVGVLLLVRLKQQSSGKSKGGLIAIAALYILSGLGGALNILSSREPNDSPAIVMSYVAGFGLFVIVLIWSRFVLHKSS
jgi:hypothetical protein